VCYGLLACLRVILALSFYPSEKIHTNYSFNSPQKFHNRKIPNGFYFLAENHKINLHNFDINDDYKCKAQLVAAVNRLIELRLNKLPFNYSLAVQYQDFVNREFFRYNTKIKKENKLQLKIKSYLQQVGGMKLK
jgi:hypothetical protein